MAPSLQGRAKMIGMIREDLERTRQSLVADRTAREREQDKVTMATRLVLLTSTHAHSLRGHNAVVHVVKPCGTDDAERSRQEALT